MKKTIIFFILLLIFSIVFSFGSLEQFRIVKDSPYVPAPISNEYRAKYIEENYNVIINSDESISYIKVIN